MKIKPGRGSSPSVRPAGFRHLAPPGIAIALVALAFTLCGRAIESVLNPKLGVGR